MDNQARSSQYPENAPSEKMNNLSAELDEIKRRAQTGNNNGNTSSGIPERRSNAGKLILIGSALFVVVLVIFVANLIKRTPSLRSKFTALNNAKATSTPVVSPTPEGEGPTLVDTNAKSTPTPVSGPTTSYVEKNGLYSFEYSRSDTKTNYTESGLEGVRVYSKDNNSSYDMKVIYIKGKNQDARKEAEEVYAKAKYYVKRNETLSNISSTKVGDKDGVYYTIAGFGEARDYFVNVKDGVVRIKVIITGADAALTEEKAKVDSIVKSFDFTPDTSNTTKGGL